MYGSFLCLLGWLLRQLATHSPARVCSSPAEDGMLGTFLDSFAARILNIKQIWLMRSTCWTLQSWSEVEITSLPSLAVPCWQARLRKHECVCLWFLQGPTPASRVPGSSGGSSFQRLSPNPSYGRVLLNWDPGHLVGQFYRVPEPSWRPSLEPTSAALPRHSRALNPYIKFLSAWKSLQYFLLPALNTDGFFEYLPWLLNPVTSL